MGERAAAQLGASSLAELRSKSAEELLAVSAAGAGTPSAPNTFTFVPIVDGWVIPDDPGVVFAQGRQTPVPLIVGTNADEASIFLLNTPVTTVEAYRAEARAQYGQYADEVLRLYPASTPAEVKAALQRSVTDARFITGAKMFAEWQSKIARAYMYHFTWVGQGLRARLGAYHAAEIPHVFGTLPDDQIAGRPLEQLPMHAMMNYWVQFAATGDPNPRGSVSWPTYGSANEQYIEFGRESKVREHLRKEGCDLFEKIANERRARRRGSAAP
jgi:para-nitrobenzyl esterase